MHKLTLSVITLSFDNLDYTQKFVKSIKENTQSDYELIIVDNGSKEDVQSWVQKTADKSILFKENKGFAKGFNAGIKIAKGKYIIMANNDTEFPKQWDIHILENFKKYKTVGLVSPTYTSGLKVALRDNINDNQIILKNKKGFFCSSLYFLDIEKFITDITILFLNSM